MELTPKEKAYEILKSLNDEINPKSSELDRNVINCATICVDEILNATPFAIKLQAVVEYWNEVKQEIQKL